jgi:2,5-diketo-D-gluconate reductase A
MNTEHWSPMSPQPDMPLITLNNGVSMPQLGLGTLANLPDEQTIRIVTTALELGYRSIDTATRYLNERGVGVALERFGLPRDQVFVTSKVWNADHGRDATLRAFDASLEKLGLDHLDLYLIHFPVPMVGRYIETWLALEELYSEGRVRAIGLANFEVAYLTEILEAGTIVPAVNQIELHPRLQQRPLRSFNDRCRIATAAWSPLGMGVSVHEPLLAEIGARNGTTPAQVILRWHLQQGRIVIPRSTNAARLRENLEAVAVPPLDPRELAAIDALDSGARIGPHPDVWGVDDDHDYAATKREYEKLMHSSRGE